LSKIESGTVVVDVGEVLLDELQRYVERNFRHVAEAKTLDFLIRLDSRLPKSMLTDAKRLQQIIKNLLSNAFKFTHTGQVTLTIEPVSGGWSAENDDLNRCGEVLAFQQADGSTSRKYGGTGLGLAISRELARLLQGEIRLASSPTRGSTFTLYVPRAYTARVTRKPTPLDTSAIANNAIEKAKYTSGRAAEHLDAGGQVPARQ
jgi:signal transduction histidine kinase